VTIPATLRDSLMARLDRYTPVKEIAQMGAAIGREFSYELIAAVAPLQHTQLDDALTSLTDSGLAFRSGAPPDAVYSFKHSLVQDAAYDSLLKSKRQALHAKIAKVLEERYPETKDSEPEVLAHHYTQANHPRDAIPLWQKAGELAAMRSAHFQVLAHYRGATGETEKLDPSIERDWIECPAQLSLGFASMPVEGWASPRARHAFESAYRLAGQLGDTPMLVFQAQWGLARLHVIASELRDARFVAERCVALGRDTGDSHIFVEALGLLGQVAFRQGGLHAGRRILVEGLVVYAPEQHRSHAMTFMQDPSVASRFFLAQLLWFLGYPDRALAMSQASVQDARELGHPFTLAWAIPGALWVRHHRGEYSEVRLFADKHAVLCRAQRFQNWQVWSGLARGYSLLHAVRAEEGLSIMQEAVASLRRFGDRQWLGFTASLLAKGSLCVGRRASWWTTGCGSRKKTAKGFGGLRCASSTASCCCTRRRTGMRQPAHFVMLWNLPASRAQSPAS
jgi:hypothetical protein